MWRQREEAERRRKGLFTVTIPLVKGLQTDLGSESQLTARFVNKVLLKHSPAHLFFVAVFIQQGRVDAAETIWPEKPKILKCLALTGKFTHSCSRSHVLAWDEISHVRLPCWVQIGTEPFAVCL